MKLEDFKVEPITFDVEEGHQIIFPFSQKPLWRGWEGPHYRAAVEVQNWMESLEIAGLTWLILGHLQTDLLVLSAAESIIFVRSFYISSRELRLPVEFSEWMQVRSDPTLEVTWRENKICIMYAADVGSDSEAISLQLAISPGVWQVKTYSHRYQMEEDQDELILHVASRCRAV